MSGDRAVSRGRTRLAYLTNIPSPYRAAMIRTWAQHNPHLSISVFYTDPDDQGRGWAADSIGHGVKETRLPVLAAVKKYGKLNRRLFAMVRNHDIIMIGGFEQASYLAAAILARMTGKPVILLFDGFSPARFGNEPRLVLALKRFTARLSQGFFANGAVGMRYLREQVGVSTDRAIHNQFLSHRDEPVKEARTLLTGMSKAQIRQRLGIEGEGRSILMSCGYLIERKRIDLIIDAIASLPEAKRPLLLVVGTGELADELKGRADRTGVPAHFAGFKLGRDLAEYYFAADGLVLASSDDPWGLVINEAMSAGLPVLVSDACGASSDLVREGINGFTFHAGDVKSLSKKLSDLLSADLLAMGKASQSIITGWTPLHSAQSLGRVVADTQKKMPTEASKGK